MIPAAKKGNADQSPSRKGFGLDRRSRPILVLLLAGFAATLGLSLSGCSQTPEEATGPGQLLLPIAKPEQLVAKNAKIASRSRTRQIEKFTLRVRNLSCAGVASGSGFAIGPRLLITNHHVVDGALLVEVNTWDGKTLKAEIASVARFGDLAVVRVEKVLPQIARVSRRFARGDQVFAVGYPGGGPLTTSPGQVLGLISAENTEDRAGRIVVSSQVRPGNSGGPLTDQSGAVIGVITEYEPSSGNGLATPASRLIRLSESGAAGRAVEPCSYIYR